MPFLTLSEKGKITSTSGNNGQMPLGKRSTFLFNTSGNGVPRGTDLLKVRRLGQTYAVELMKDTVKQQVTTTDFVVQPTSEDPTPAEEEASEQVEKFLRGGFNDNKQSFDHFLKEVLDDLLDADSGVVELVPDKDGYLAEMYVRDGITFTKNTDDHGKLPTPPGENESFQEEKHAAYYQFGLNHMAQRIISTDSDLTLRDLSQHLNKFGAQRFNIRAHEPIAFPRDRIVWFSESPRSWSPYGSGKTQKVSIIAESLLKSNLHNLTWFEENEYADGVLAIEGANQSELENYREYWRDEVRGNPHELPILGSGGKIDYLNFDPTPTEMEFLDTQKWFVKIVAMIFGLNQNEIGDLADINRATAQEQAATVFRRTTKPLLDMIEQKINNQILPKMREWDALEGEEPLEFRFQIDHPKMERIKFETNKKKLDANVMTVNEVRKDLGEDQLGEWADLPQEAIKSIARNHPEWIAEKEGIDDVPTSGFGGGGGLFGNSNNDNDDDDSGESGGSGSEGDGRRDDVRNHRIGYKEAFENPQKFSENLKDEALRNSRSNQFPPLKSHIDQFSKDVGKKFLEAEDDVIENLMDTWPEKGFNDASEKDILARISDIMDSVDLKDAVGEVLIGFNRESLENSADFHAKKVEKELEEMNDNPDVDIEIDFDVENSFAHERMRQRSLQSATEINDAVKDQVKTVLREGQKEGWGARKTADEISDRFETISDNHAELVARTETLSSSREGSQAMAESTDVIDRKEWIATNDSRTREWHDAMDGEIKRKDQDFVVPQLNAEGQPSNYPRSVMVVGQDQPFNCRCSQAPVVDDQFRSSGKTDWLKFSEEFESLDVDLDVTERQFEVWIEHGKSGESFSETWNRLAEEKGSVTKLSDIVSRPTVYEWNNQFDVNL